jgi:hypothetical protein
MDDLIYNFWYIVGHYSPKWVISTKISHVWINDGQIRPIKATIRLNDGNSEITVKVSGTYDNISEEIEIKYDSTYITIDERMINEIKGKIREDLAKS